MDNIDYQAFINEEDSLIIKLENINNKVEAWI